MHKSVLACLVVERFCNQMPRSGGVPVPQSLGSGWLPEHKAMTPLGRGVGNGPALLGICRIYQPASQTPGENLVFCSAASNRNGDKFISTSQRSSR